MVSIPDARAAVAIAILYQNNCFLMQLREDKPGIAYPGCWAFFGGHLEPGEPPAIAMERELLEEIGYAPPNLMLFKTYTQDEQFIRHVFYAPLTVELNTLELHEGCDLGLATIEEIQIGKRYSERVGQVYPLGQPHRQILLEFIQQFGDRL
jgi:8-oxo-dGTP diphosphatase